MLAAHYPADTVQLAGVGDHRHGGIETIAAAIEGQDLLALARHAHGEIARELLRIEHMQRPAQIEGYIIGDIDQRRDRPEANGGQAMLQPARAGPVPEPTEIAADD